MDTVLVKKGFDFSRRKKKWIILLGLIGFSSYGVYKVYHMPSVVRKRMRIMKLFGAIISMAEMVSESAETISVVSKDFKEFLKSDSDEIPTSLKQLSKVALSEEFSESVIRVSQAMTVGILRGYKLASNRSEIQEVDNSLFLDMIMDKLMSSTGTGFISVIVGSFARNLILGFYADGKSVEGLKENDHLDVSRWVDMVSDDKCRVLMADCIKTFVRTAVTVYLDKTMDINFYDEIFSGMTNPKHQNKVKVILVSICNGAVETLVKTSHRVLTASKSNPASGSSSSSLIFDQSEASNMADDKDHIQEASLGKVKETNRYVDLQNSGWVTSVSSTLAVPSNRKFVLDVTGRVTFETVRSVVEFFWWKILECLKRSLNVVRYEVVERGLEVIRYFGAKSSVILILCLALFIYVGCNQRLLPELND